MTPEERALLKRDLQKNVKSGRQAHFLYCMSGPERKPVLLLGRRRGAIISAHSDLKRSAHKKVFLTGQVVIKPDRSGIRFEVRQRAGRAMAAMQRDLRRVFGKATPRLRTAEVVLVSGEEEPEEAPLPDAVLDVADVLDEAELEAILSMPAPTPLPPEKEKTKRSISRWFKKRGKAIGKGLKKAAKQTGRFLSRAGTAIKDFFEALGSTCIGRGMVIHTDLDEVMDVVKLVDGLSLDRKRSSNRVRIELHPFDRTTIVTADELALSSLSMGGLVVGPALLKGVRIELKEGRDGLPVHVITVDRVEAEDITITQDSPTTIRDGVLHGLTVILTQTGPTRDGETPNEIAISLDKGHLREVAREGEYIDDLRIRDATMSVEDGVHIEVAQADASGVDLAGDDSDIHAEVVHSEGIALDQRDEKLRFGAETLKATDASVTLTPGPKSEDDDGVDVPRMVETLAEHVDDAAVRLRAPVRGPGPAPSLVSVPSDTTMDVSVSVSDGQLVPGETRLEFSEPLNGPAWLGLRGAYLDESGTLKADIAGFFDIGFGGYVNDALGLEGETIPELHRIGAAIAQKMREDDDRSGGDNPLSSFDLEKTTATGRLHLSPGRIDGGEALSVDVLDSGDGVDVEADHEQILTGFRRLLIDSFALGDGLSAGRTDLSRGQGRVGHGEHSGEIEADVSAVTMTNLSLER